MCETRDPRIVFAIGLARVLLSILVVYAFLATLMTASAQQSISAGLKDVANEDGKPDGDGDEGHGQADGKPGPPGKTPPASPEKRART
jgi:hypothetical protein